MNKLEIFYWLLFSFAVLAFVLVYISYRKSYDIIRPPKRRVPVTVHPEQFHLAYETINFTASDGIELNGWFIPAEGGETDKTIIFCHGWGTNKGEILKDTHFLSEQGFNLFYFDFRASGDSKGDISSVGYLEIRDLDGAVKFLRNFKQKESECLSLYGCSMGGSVAVYGARHYPEIKCLLSESTFLSYKNVVKNWSWNRLKVPYFPMVMMTLYFVRRKLKVDSDLYSPLYNITDVKLPCLFINGDNDDLVPVEDAKKLFELCPSKEKDFWLIKGSSHAKCAEVAGQVFIEKVSEFFRKYAVAGTASREPAAK